MSEAAVAEATQAIPQETQAPVTTEPLEASPSASETQGAEVQNPIGEGTEPEAAKEENDHLTAAIEAAKKAEREQTEARIKRELAEQQAQEKDFDDYQSYLAGVKQSFDQRAPALRSYLYNQGLSEEAVNTVLNQFTAHHGQSASVRDYEYQRALLDHLRESLGDDAVGEIQQARRQGKIRNYQDILKEYDRRVTAKAREGYLSPTQVEEKVAFARAAAVDAKKAAGATDTSTTSTARSGSANSMTLAQIDAMPMNEWMAKPREERQRLLDDAHRMERR